MSFICERAFGFDWVCLLAEETVHTPVGPGTVSGTQTNSVANIINHWIEKHKAESPNAIFAVTWCLNVSRSLVSAAHCSTSSSRNLINRLLSASSR